MKKMILMMMLSRLVVLPLLLQLHSVNVNGVVVAASEEKVLSSSSLSGIHCTVGWSTTSDSNHRKRVEAIPHDWINDGYCDCPYDGGIDEPNTNACSGAHDWPGIDITATAVTSAEEEEEQQQQQETRLVPFLKKKKNIIPWRINMSFGLVFPTVFCFFFLFLNHLF